LALRVYTGTIYNYRNIPDGLDISVKSAPEDGQAFIPTWDMVLGYKEGRIREEEYVIQYREKMLRSQFNSPEKWAKLLARPRVTLLCYCHPAEFCHRYLLAAMLVNMGAQYMGEAELTTEGIMINKSTLDIVDFWAKYFKDRS